MSISFRRKLARLESAGPEKRRTKEEVARAQELQDALDALKRRHDRARPVASAKHASEEALRGKYIENKAGSFYRIDRVFKKGESQGRVCIASALRVSSELVAELSLDCAFEDVDLSKMLFIDTETTGLRTASGTLAFLIGIAFFEEESLRVEQLFLRDLNEEASVLHYLGEKIAQASCVVSYNGKSFDWPLLRTRFVMKRVAAPPLPPHLDLLHCARRVYKGRLSSIRLVDIERELLAFMRVDDVRGAEIPEIYLRYLRLGDQARLDAVIEHNAYDLISLAAILGELVRRFDHLPLEFNPHDYLGFARVAERAGDRKRAIRFSEAAGIQGNADCAYHAWMLRARVARRQRDISEEKRALLAALQARSTSEIHTELAKFYEHRAKDLPRAISHAWEINSEEERSLRLRRLSSRLARQNRRSM